MLSGTPGYREAVPVPEAGFVNPPEAPKVAAESPEHAASLQGVTAPLTAEDELDALSRDQLKALAVLIGAEPENTRKRETALRESIRVHRAESEGQVTSVLLGTEVAPEAPQLEDAPPPLAEEVSAREGSRGYVLYLGCSPLDGSVVPFSAIARLANDQVCAAQNVRDYRTVPWGAGPGMLSAIVSELLDLYDGCEIYAEMCPSTICCMDVLISKAARVVRALS
jgi:hypothetical protein